MDSDPGIPLARIASFVRQHTHDFRNGLNGLDLEAALLQEIISDDEGRECIGRIRQQVRSLAERLRQLSARFNDPRPYRAPLTAHELLLIWREQNRNLPGPLDVTWEDQVAGERVEVDVEALAEIFHELLVNAAKYSPSGPVSIVAHLDQGEVVLEMREPKAAPVDVTGWGEAPFTAARRGAYGLGLWTIHRLTKASGGGIRHEFTPTGALLTRLNFQTI